MAYTKIKAVKNHLKRCLDYAANPAKTKRGKTYKTRLPMRTIAIRQNNSSL